MLYETQFKLATVERTSNQFKFNWEKSLFETLKCMYLIEICLVRLRYLYIKKKLYT